MRYHYEIPSVKTSMYGETYICDHPVYSRCTLIKIGEKGLAIIQQRFNPTEKKTWWAELEPGLADRLYLNPNFKEYFDSRADICKNGLYPTVTIRQIMWALRMKPLSKHRWETAFDRRDI